MKKRLSKSLKRFLKKNKMEEVIDALKNSEDSKNYYDFSVSNKVNISYLKGDRIPEKSHLIFDKNYREKKAYHAKIGKLLNAKIDNKIIQKISSIMQNRGSGYKIIESRQFKKYYLEDNYSKHYTGGILYNSCMRYETCQDAIGFYRTVPEDDLVLLVILDDEGNVLARALHWVSLNYIDRVYAASPNFEQLYREYAAERKIDMFERGRLRSGLNIHIRHDQPMPYFDTFKNYDGMRLNSEDEGEYRLESVEGECLDELSKGGYICEACGDRIDEGEDRYSDHHEGSYCDDCVTYLRTECDYILDSEIVDVNGVQYHRDNEDIVYCAYNNTLAHIEDYVYSEYLGEGINTYMTEYVSINNGDDYMPLEHEDVVEIEDEYYTVDNNNIVYSKIQKEYILKSDSEFSKRHNTHFFCDNEEFVWIEEKEDYYHKTLDKHLITNRVANKYELINKQYELVVV